MNLKKYCLITFSSTSHALKAEKIMKELEREFLLMPTLREISSSCGLSLKFRPENLNDYYQELLDRNVSMDGVYEVEINGRKNMVKPKTM
ncbi:MAG: DUF3343 domain-containing protein [Syntrophomonadaceae bacterium]|nr:DUF3343 domain-containing protein [Syntrophomonadaceae bacterium]